MHNNIMEQKITPTEWCLCRIVRQKHDYMELYPNLTKIIEMILFIPVGNAWPERGASKVRLVKTYM